MFHRPNAECGNSLGIKRTLTYVFQLEVSPSGLAPTIPWGPRGLWAHAGHCRALWALQTVLARAIRALAKPASPPQKRPPPVSSKTGQTSTGFIQTSRFYLGGLHPPCAACLQRIRRQNWYPDFGCMYQSRWDMHSSMFGSIFEKRLISAISIIAMVE